MHTLGATLCLCRLIVWVCDVIVKNRKKCLMKKNLTYIRSPQWRNWPARSAVNSSPLWRDVETERLVVRVHFGEFFFFFLHRFYTGFRRFFFFYSGAELGSFPAQKNVGFRDKVSGSWISRNFSRNFWFLPWIACKNGRKWTKSKPNAINALLI